MIVSFVGNYTFVYTFFLIKVVSRSSCFLSLKDETLEVKTVKQQFCVFASRYLLFGCLMSLCIVLWFPVIILTLYLVGIQLCLMLMLHVFTYVF